MWRSMKARTAGLTPLEVLVAAAEDDLLLDGPDEAPGDAVGLGLANEGEAGADAEEGELALEVVGPERAAVIGAQQDAAGGVGTDGAEDVLDRETERLGGGAAIAVLGGLPAPRRSSARPR